ncbi:hypothetical protein LO80_08510 [Candidatus Francisella endociliophora]|uniref:Glycosyltransferase n=1 Tax=Candidatus Francisella endociliophora TaxID=653937 RepID=A0A097ER40_9GAMM|nr:hypothetical protein [Francisella sp. FSC1006]AIT10007.1 hypothetical protein LO80_08510 [Francisella sp. FSC1006]
MGEKSKSLAVLISSYDKSEDLWKPLSESYERYWKSSRYKIYLGTNYLDPLLPRFEALKIGKEKSWSDNILKCLDKIDEDYILLTFDDLFLFSDIDNKKIDGLIMRAMENDWDYLRLHPSPTPDIILDDDIGQILPNRMYRASTVFSIIKKDTFRNLLIDTESAWEFERNASMRSNCYDKFYVSRKKLIPYLNAVVKGKWVTPALNYLKKDGFSVVEESRKKMSTYELIIESIMRLRLKIFFMVVPKGMQGYIREKVIKKREK